MGVELVLGSSGAGKTHYMYKKITESDSNENYFAIVPEQYTMETQRKIVSMCAKNEKESIASGTFNIDIVSFNRLAVRLFDETGTKAGEILDDTGKAMVLRKVMEQEKNNLSIFKSKIGYVGFVDEMKSLISELYQYGIDNEKLKQLEEKTHGKSVLEAKIHDVRIIEAAFREYLSDKFITSEEIMKKLCDIIPNSKIIKNSTITLDGYTGFTTLQYRVIEQLIRYAKDVIISITIDPLIIDNDENEIGDLFSLSTKTIQKLEKISNDNNYKVKKTIINDTKPYRYGNSEELCWLEKNLFKYSNVKYEDECTDIKIVEARNVQDECKYICAAINHYVRNEGYRYKDIAIITGDMENYSHQFEKQFENYNIPGFIDKTRNMSNNPFVESIRALLQTVDENYSYEGMFRFLRCGMTDITREEIDLLENYILAHGIKSYKRWNEKIEDDTRIEYSRAQLMEFLDDIYKGLKKRNATVKDYSKIVYEYIVKCDGQAKLQAYIDEFEENGDKRKANEYAQIYKCVIELLDKIVFLMGDEIISLNQYIDVMETGLAEIKVGTIPPTIDRIIVGDIERTRVDNIKILFFVGVNDGNIPKSEGSKGIFSEIDRNFIEECDIELAPSARENALIQKFYLYTIMTKMSEKLIVSYSRSSIDGSPLRQSYLITTLLAKYPKLSVASSEKEMNDISVMTMKIMEKQVALKLREFVGRNEEITDEWKEMFNAIPEKNKEKILDAAFYKNENDNLNKAVAKAIYGDVLKGSVSRLETFAACAYRHFLAYGIALEPRKQYEVKATDVGIFYHTVLEKFSSKVKELKLDWLNIESSVRRELVRQSFEEVKEKYGNGVMNSTARDSYQLHRMYEITDRTVWALCEQISKGEFRPEGFEIRFDADKNTETLEFELEDSLMKLKGTIDRVDLYETEENVFVKIIDYKSGNKKFDIIDVYNGIQLQLVLYMEAARDMVKSGNKDKKVIPAGLMYYDIKNPILNKNSEQPLDSILEALKPNGLINSSIEVIEAMDKEMESESKVIPVKFTKNGIHKNSSVATTKDIEALMEYVHNKTKSFGESIMNGEISTNPYKKSGSSGENPCTYCDFKTICKFDSKLSGNNYRKIETKNKDEIWEKIREEVKTDE